MMGMPAWAVDMIRAQAWAMLVLVGIAAISRTIDLVSTPNWWSAIVLAGYASVAFGSVTTLRFVRPTPPAREEE